MYLFFIMVYDHTLERMVCLFYIYLANLVIAIIPVYMSHYIYHHSVQTQMPAWRWLHLWSTFELTLPSVFVENEVSAWCIFAWTWTQSVTVTQSSDKNIQTLTLHKQSLDNKSQQQPNESVKVVNKNWVEGHIAFFKSYCSSITHCTMSACLCKSYKL